MSKDVVLCTELCSLQTYRLKAAVLDAFKINDEIVGNMRGWKHSGFSVDNSVRIERGDEAGM